MKIAKHRPVALPIAVNERRQVQRDLKIITAILALIIATWLFTRLASAEDDPATQNLNNQLNAANASTALRNGTSNASGSGKAAQMQRARDQQKKDQADFKEQVFNNLASVKDLFASAEAAWKDEHYGLAASLYRSVEMATVPGAETMVETARGRRIELEDLAKGHLKNVEDADLNQDYSKEIEELDLILREFKTTTANDVASQKMINLKSRAEVAGFIEYSQAESLEKDGKLMDAIKIYTSVANNARYEHSIPALKAQRRLDDLNKNEETRNKIKAELAARADKEAPVLLNTAKNFILNGKPKLALEKLQTVIDKYPDSPYAQQAKQQIEELGK
jgi:hypothetical protein